MRLKRFFNSCNMIWVVFILRTGGFWSILKINKNTSIERDEDHSGTMASQITVCLHSPLFSLLFRTSLVCFIALLFNHLLCRPRWLRLLAAEDVWFFSDSLINWRPAIGRDNIWWNKQNWWRKIGKSRGIFWCLQSDFHRFVCSVELHGFISGGEQGL